MSYYITNGDYFIRINPNGGIKKTTEQNAATAFPTGEDAERAIKKAPAKTKGYQAIPMQSPALGKSVDVEDEERDPLKRKKLAPSLRKVVYAKDEGRCYLCGEKVAEDAFEIEHKIPVAKGGTNNLSNLYVACHICNTMKNSMLFEEFMQKVTMIAKHQTNVDNQKNILVVA